MANETGTPSLLGNLNNLISGGSPLFNLGIGLLSAPQGATFGQSLAQGVGFASNMQQSQLRNQFLRDGLREKQTLREAEARRTQALRELQEMLTGGGGAPSQSVGAPIQLAAAFAPGGGLPGVGPDGRPVPLDESGAVPGVSGPGGGALSRRQQLLGLLAEIAPEALAQQAVTRAFPQPQNPTNLQREFEFLISQGVAPEKALEALQKGTVVNVGGAEPLSVTDLTKIHRPDGTAFSPGTTLAQAVEAGGVVRTPEQQKQATSAAGSLDMLNDLERVVVENNIETGFIDEGGISELLATPAGQVVAKGAGLLGVDLALTPAQAQALSLQNNLSNAVLAAMRGASVGPEEQEKFERQLPRLSQPPEVFKANVKNTRRNLQELAQRKQGGQGETQTSGGGADFSALAPQDLLNVDVIKLSPAQREAYAAALDAAGF